MHIKYLNVICKDLFDYNKLTVGLLNSVGFVYYAPVDEWILQVKDKSEILGFVVYDGYSVYAERPEDPELLDIFTIESNYILDTLKEFMKY